MPRSGPESEFPAATFPFIPRPDNIETPDFTDFIRRLGDVERAAEQDQKEALSKTLSAMPPELRSVVLAGILRIATTVLGNEQVIVDETDILVSGDRADVYQDVFSELIEDRVFDPTHRANLNSSIPEE